MLKKPFKSSFSTRGIVIWMLAASFFLYEFFLRTFIGSVAGQIIPDLGLNVETFALLASAYAIAYGLMQIPVGVLTDRYGVKIILIFAALVCAVATFFFAHAHSFVSAFTSRLAMGFGSSFAFVCLLVVVATWFPRKNFAFFAGVSQFIGTMGPFLAGGPLIALLYFLHGNWRATLSLIGGFGIVLAILMVFIVKNKPPNVEHSTIFVARAYPVKTQLLKLMRNKQAWLVAIYSGCVYVSIEFLAAMWGNVYLQARGITQQGAGNIISLAWVGYAIGCPLLGALSDFGRRRKPWLIITAIVGFFTTFGITYLPLRDTPGVYSIFFFLLGIAAAGQNLGFATISEHVEKANRATALGLNNGAVTLFTAMVPPSASYFIYRVTGPSGMAMHNPHTFMLGFSIMPLLYLVGAFIAIFLIKETYCRPQKEVIKVNL